MPARDFQSLASGSLDLTLQDRTHVAQLVREPPVFLLPREKRLSLEHRGSVHQARSQASSGRLSVTCVMAAPERLLIGWARRAERRLRRSQAGDRDAERAAAHVVEAQLVAELDAGGVAAVLAADAE